MMKLSIQVFVLSLFASRRIHAYTAYLSYTNATCKSDGGITGTMVMSYDDEALSDFGYSMNYNSGVCLAFQEGSWSFLDADDSAGYYDWPEYSYTATCVTCNGVTGCSSDGTCDNFLTYAGNSTISYQLSSSSSSGMLSSSSSSKKQVSENALGMAQAIQISIEQETNQLSMSASSSAKQQEEDSGTTSNIFVATGGTGAFMAVAVVGALLRRRRAHVRTGEAADEVEMAYHRDSSPASGVVV